MEHYQKETHSCLRMQVPLCDRSGLTELSADFSLPDYLPEIKRLLRVRATALPPDKYIGAGNADFTGAIEYAILYSDNDGALYCVTEHGEYQLGVPLETVADIDLNDGITCDTDIVPETVSGRVAAPRKVSVKCRLRTHVRLYGTRCLEESVTGAARDSIQRLCGQAEAARLFVGTGEPLQLGDEILCDTQNEGDMRVISTEGQIFVNEAIAGSGAVNCRGEVCLKLLCTREGSANLPTPLLRRIPFTQSIPTEGAEVNCDACADGVCHSIHVTVEDGKILCEVSVSLRARAMRNETVSYTRDIYSTSAVCDPHFVSCTATRALKCGNGNFSLNSSFTAKELGIKSDMNVVDVALTPAVTSVESDHGKYYVNGRCRTHLILSDGEEISAQELEIPFRYETDGTAEDVTEYSAAVTPISCRARADGERIALDAELSVGLCLRSESRFDMLSDASFGEAVNRSGAVYTICYPSREDTLWSIAKRYHRPVSSVFEINALSGAPAADTTDSLAGVGYLLV